ncbi:MAG: hypothetical protein KKE73_12930 [Proteobacteria bacterium]|nr:hypothetical protein [Pseudomonadota bacterium]
MLQDNYGLRFFSSKVPPARRRAITAFAIFFISVIFLQAFYWLFANAAEPIIMGLPFGMFMVTFLIGVELVGLLVMDKVLFSNEKEDD